MRLQTGWVIRTTVRKSQKNNQEVWVIITSSGWRPHSNQSLTWHKIESFGKKKRKKKHEIAQVTAQLQAQVEEANLSQKHKNEMYNKLHTVYVARPFAMIGARSSRYIVAFFLAASQS